MKDGWYAKLDNHIEIHIPENLIKVFKAMDAKFKTEWMLYLKVEKIEDNKVYLGIEYYVPEQEVSTASVEPKELPPEGFDVVIHKHPSGITSFSSTDWENVNGNSKISLLWVNNEIRDAAVMVRFEDYPLRVGKDLIKIIIDEELPEIPEEALRKIKEKTLGKDVKVITKKDFDCKRYRYHEYYNELYANDLDTDINEDLYDAVRAYTETLPENYNELYANDLDLDINEDLYDAVRAYIETLPESYYIDQEDIKTWLKERGMEADNITIRKILDDFGYEPY